ncbi:hypothetical protein ABB37_01485 [Leptomonas pyrrhocoris]|uniref:Uncharacterized protein n=1 Tax=Leptomonas pyrrhocoris TaxID=157538 RepID=A0A0N0DZB1_LEPPY|nr:hypothetical protein ABB37_01485 [Leptomonas pyrrhocoris]XP_015663510.1 hypothetical protein ABB37_01485 [Leptomonas pyrrhocoris]XP_015663511.1 hypothetical protein ABB37_01485 [Leptomonas pyrrhocoris]KPA85070.1 hypothetical protein ABB37_01485 [Leptomonas pyrrhocoris]KPA85071.1 hypothetical protein ABB37_01485 [Leptomonas pyrrhocoris]KPA85072.1 hypothetical protein ABB37_01485 [Leptomonas pyrrhocoris]|eukprot:XP_015663509.1 hypothetical protein ABB37_01485 [Leptomonas pyrrhocoris]
MEEYVTDASLSETACSVAYPDLILRCVVLATVPLRACEFRDEKVFTAVGCISPLSPNDAGSCAKPVRVNFYGSWGMAAAFMESGDVMVLQGFYRLDPPSAPEVASGDALASAPSSVFVCPLPEEEGCVLRVLQPGKGGDVMEVLVTPSNMDAICMHGLTKSDAANHLYVHQCLAGPNAQQEEGRR